MFGFLLISGIQAICVPISATTVCNLDSSPSPYSIDVDQVSQVYGIPASEFNASIWESQLIKTTTAGVEQAKLWKFWSYCNGYGGQSIQYYRSNACFGDLFVTSKECNQDINRVKLCPTVCKAYGAAINNMLSNSSMCPSLDGLDQRKASMYERRRASLSQAEDQCLSINPDSTDCVEGVASDLVNCGFGDKMGTGSKFCIDNPTSSCCSTMASKEGFVSRMMGQISKSLFSPDQGSETQFVKSVAFIIVCVIVGVSLLGVASYFIIKKIRREPKFVALEEALADATKEEILIQEESRLMKYIVKYDYNPNLGDEIELKVGDILIFDSLSDGNRQLILDGWGNARNITSGLNGKACVRFAEKVSE